MCYFWLTGWLFPTSFNSGQLFWILGGEAAASRRFLHDVFGAAVPCHSLLSSNRIINQTALFMKYLRITPSLLFEHHLFPAPEHFILYMIRAGPRKPAVHISPDVPISQKRRNICIILSVWGGVIPWQAYNASLIKHNMIGIPHIMYSVSWAGRWFMIS